MISFSLHTNTVDTRLNEGFESKGKIHYIVNLQLNTKYRVSTK